MYVAMILQFTECSKRLITDITAVRSLACVYTAVTVQSTNMSECPTADVTTVRPLSGMSDQMTPQMTRIVRGVLARLALVLAVPPDVTVTSLHVLIQKILIRTHDVAIITADQRATCQTPSIVSYNEIWNPAIPL